ncbi:hypothetical protein TREMEDRAFT_57534 [Tremella mesenterica DSM 1558]|uniref:uncharacterized protein n=1 Tax=Tremella mesenterica (strain ATCC 24925 / CBS 8224 / DSM 1558 / NBRC 9311 / NRRL Y-6157 / RJB 2259-6 / UBC 559-6) TaxID=578456 RepID=UPI0003F49652|nr:uncharacterized protein TREMEDRAFT_57534 [Tremella mesenterica DSM 1558]EIW67164.1 hypothetical protein TREMEDRAFT_57534 [Tremella mesenterica DSM 1558]
MNMVARHSVIFSLSTAPLQLLTPSTVPILAPGTSFQNKLRLIPGRCDGIRTRL